MQPSPAAMTADIAAALAAVREATARLDHLTAFDRADRAARAHPAAAELEYAAILALANAGATAAAERRLAAFDPAPATTEAAHLAGRRAALRGRLLKDRALASHGPARIALAAAATDAYEAAGAVYGGHYYPAINAAATAVLAGERGRAEHHASLARQYAAGASPDYWSIATAAEAALILGDLDAANAAYSQAGALAGTELDRIAATRRQRAWLLPALDVPADAVPGPPAPLLLYWVADQDASASDVAGLVAELLRLRAAAPAALFFGPLLGAADLLVAQQLIAAGSRPELVLPCAAAAHREHLDPDHAALFDGVMAAGEASSVTVEGHGPEPVLAGLSLQQVRGDALLRGRRFDAPVRRATLRAGQPPVITGDPGRRDPVLDGIVWTPHQDRGQRIARALVFGDVRGYSRLTEAEQLRFTDHIIGGFADALAAGGVSYAETAGDGLYVVFDHVAAAARAAEALHAVVSPARLAAARLPAHLSLRLSAHVGPVFRVFDRVIGRERYCGAEVIRTARIEPVTPPGETYVTEQFAAALVCADAAAWTCDYVGIQPMAKGFGACRMYTLRPAVLPARPAAV
jgi:hypothetical protein